ncbi:MAG: BrnT family toxin [Acidobacteriota bacterium]
MAEFEYRFDWDPVKAQRNARDHGVTFEQAATVFLDPGLLSQLDEEHGEEEERWVSLGLDKSTRLLVVCHTYREITKVSATIRIFSARKATRQEGKDYEKRKP